MSLLSRNLNKNLDMIKKLYYNLIEIDLCYNILKFQSEPKVLKQNLELTLVKYEADYLKLEMGELISSNEIKGPTVDDIISKYYNPKYTPPMKPIPLNKLYKKSELLKNKLPLVEPNNFDVIKKIKKLQEKFLQFKIVDCCKIKV